MFRFLILTFVAVATGNVIHEGKCPDLKPVENFNTAKYVGTWYEISKYPTENEKNGTCAAAEYTLDGEVVKVKNSHVIAGVQVYIEGTARLAPDANKAGKLIVSLKFGDVTRDSPLLVLATDYSNYAIAFNCIYDEKTKKHEDHVWVMSRSKKLEGTAKSAVDDFLKANSKYLDSTKLVHTNFSDEACKYTSSSPITEITKPVKS